MTKEILSSIYDYTLDELKERLKPSFRAKQVYNWLYKKYANSYDDMKNLPKELIEDLKTNYPIDILKVIKKEQSRDGSIKYLFKLRDNHTIEAVLLLMKDKNYSKFNFFLQIIDCRDNESPPVAEWKFGGQIEKVIWNHFDLQQAIVTTDEGKN